MSYIGNTPTQQNFVAGSDQFNGTGSQTVFTLSRNVNTVNDIQVVVSNVPQDPFSAYTVAGNSLTFTSAPPSGTGNVYVMYRATNVQTFVPTQGVSPSFGNLTYTGTLTGSTGVMNIGSGQVYKDASGNVGIGTTSPGFKTEIVSSYNNGLQVKDTSATVYGGIFVESGVMAYGVRSNHPLRFIANDIEQARLTAAGLFQFNSGYGSVATAYGCRAWVNFNGTGTVAIRASGNVSSITDQGNGNYLVNFATAMPNADLAALATSNEENGVPHYCNQTQPSTTNVRVKTYNSSAAASDCTFISVAIFR